MTIGQRGQSGDVIENLKPLIPSFMDLSNDEIARSIDNGHRLSSDYHTDAVKRPLNTIDAAARSSHNYALEPSIMSMSTNKEVSGDIR